MWRWSLPPLPSPWRMATQRTGALPAASVNPMASMAPRAIRAHSSSESTRSLAGLVREQCQPIGSPFGRPVVSGAAR